ncbi:type II toxin-antitoxin system HipA family toxin YjjJ [Simulacricoccus sp. 17bor-14]|nr:type II toxin-antitoxin system HipA family toxin YjjJ [Simulacricoccus sp. 17bor-14]
MQPVGASELAAALGTSRPTVSRFLQGLGDRVCQMGRTRGTRYVLTRALEGLGSRLPLWRITEAGRAESLGELHLLATGDHWLQREHAPAILFEGIPPFVVDMSPQGYLGRTFALRHPELSLPEHLQRWTDDQRLLALARRGEDCVGNLVLGRESLDRWLQDEVRPVQRESYPKLATGSAQNPEGSSAGGEQPKFLAFVEGRHVLVKFVGGDGAAADRRRDLLVCEHLALEHLREAGVDAARSRWFDLGGFRFLEVERFDRVGLRGRRGLLSLAALDAYVGAGRGWRAVARGLREQGWLDAGQEQRVRWLDVFGQLTGNTDRHLGNLSLFAEVDATPLQVAPCYDMLPMLFAPHDLQVVERDFKPEPPTSETLDVWSTAAAQASAYWERLAASPHLGDALRARAEHCGAQLAQLRARVAL